MKIDFWLIVNSDFPNMIKHHYYMNRKKSNFHHVAGGLFKCTSLLQSYISLRWKFISTNLSLILQLWLSPGGMRVVVVEYSSNEQILERCIRTWYLRNLRSSLFGICVNVSDVNKNGRKVCKSLSIIKHSQCNYSITNYPSWSTNNHDKQQWFINVR